MQKTNKKGMAVLHATCAMLFIAFTFCYLYFYQADLMSAEQHVLSGGKTHYVRLTGALIITASLYLLHLGVQAITHLMRRAHALTYYPSLLVLLVLTAIEIEDGSHYSFGQWLWLGPILLVLILAVAYFVKQVDSIDSKKASVGLFSRLYWENLMLLCLGFLCVGLFSNHNDVFHYRLRAEACLINRDYEGALASGAGAASTDAGLTRLRVHALAKRRQLGERLFEYPLSGGSGVLKPGDSGGRTIIYPSYNIVRIPAADYALCGLLLDKKIDAFAAEIGKYYSIDSLLPKHYREALVLYNRLRSAPVAVYHDEVAYTDYADFQRLLRQEREAGHSIATLKDAYGRTYWYYYYSE